MHVCMYACMHVGQERKVCVCVKEACMHACMHASLCVCMYVCMYVSMYVGM